ncbi:HEAT repeat domain-containing protein [Dactylosporangium sp. NPDC051485]|uniref:HEAT repeat domain-containing protein n=1 Tax=Dactylosporangium sp. NPDC051485 TaxID=3154846 RepID=UPI00342AEB7E
MISVIVRFKNEANYLAAVLQAIRTQSSRERVQVVAVDNLSSDGSRRIASEYADMMLDIDDYRPGAALNKAIDACSGSSVVILSAHAIPAHDRWLDNLSSWLANPAVLGTYGGQLYPITSRFLDKRDLDIFSSLTPRTEARDSDFWNANSVFHRTAWEKEQFDEETIELEDHYWTKRHLAQGDQWVRFEPSALVYHYGHEARNDRTFLPPSALSDEQRIRRAIGVLDSGDESWPAVMSAGLTIATLSEHPVAADAVAALGRTLASHPDFDVRWRVAGALGRIRHEDSARHLSAALADPSFYARDEAAWSLGRLGTLAVPELRRVAPTLGIEHQPFAALALGLTGDEAAAQMAIDLLRRGIVQGDKATRRDALYFLGEVTAAPQSLSLLPMVLAYVDDTDADLARAATWCWGALASRYPEAAQDGAARIVELIDRHPIETVRYEAVVALGKAVQAAPAAQSIRHIERALGQDGAGRVRYAAMQTLRLLAPGGAVSARAAAGHDNDPDFGVRFERQLLLRDLGSAD